MLVRRKAPLYMAIALLAGIIFVPAESHAEEPSAVPEPVTAETVGKPVQVFDIAKGKVVTSLPNTSDMQRQAQSWLARIGPLSPQLKPAWSSGIVVRIPLDRPVRLPDPYGDRYAEELFIHVSAGSKRKAELLVFTKKNQPLLFAVQEDLAPFLQKYNLSEWLKKSQPNE